MTDNEQYTPTESTLREVYWRYRAMQPSTLNVGDVDAEFDRWLAATLAAHRVTLVADSREALVQIVEDAFTEAEEAHANQMGRPWIPSEVAIDALLTTGVVSVDAEKQKRVEAMHSARDAIRAVRGVPVDALGFPTQEGATFTAIVKSCGNRRRFVVLELDKFQIIGTYGYFWPTELDHTSIEDVRPFRRKERTVSGMPRIPGLHPHTVLELVGRRCAGCNEGGCLPGNHCPCEGCDCNENEGAQQHG